MWARITADEIALRKRNVEAVTKRLWEEILQQRISRDVGRFCLGAVRNRRRLERAFAGWNRRTKDILRAREQERDRVERIRNFESIALEGNRKGKERMLYDEDEDGLDELDFGGLSIGAVDLDRLRKEGEAADREMARKALKVHSISSCTLAHTKKTTRQAQEDRETLWSPGTFLDLFAKRIDSVLPVEKRSSRSEFDAIVSTRSLEDSFSTWLACKFGLEGGDRSVEIETALADIEVSLVDGSSKVSHAVRVSSTYRRAHSDCVEQSFENVGLVIFECSLPSKSADLTSVIPPSPFSTR